MNMNDLVSTLMAIDGAIMCRQAKHNFVAIPAEVVDGVQTYLKVSVATALSKDTKSNPAFNPETAHAEYEEWLAESTARAEERANKPPRQVGPNPEAQARRDALDALISGLSSVKNATATEIFNALTDAGTLPDKTTVMSVGSSAKRLVEAGKFSVEVGEDKKKRYSKVA